MRLISLTSAALITLAAAGTVSAADDGAGFAALNGVKAVPMAASELDAVKGMHFHFVNAAEKLLLVNIKQGARFANDSAGDNPAGGPTPNFDIAPDGLPVGKGYHGLCVSHSVGGIFIPGNISAQCAP